MHQICASSVLASVFFCLRPLNSHCCSVELFKAAEVWNNFQQMMKKVNFSLLCGSCFRVLIRQTPTWPTQNKKTGENMVYFVSSGKCRNNPPTPFFFFKFIYFFILESLSGSLWFWKWVGTYLNVIRMWRFDVYFNDSVIFATISSDTPWLSLLPSCPVS